MIEGTAKAMKAIPHLAAIAGPGEIEQAFANLIKGNAQGLIVLPHAVTNAHRARSSAWQQGTGCRECFPTASMWRPEV